MQNKTALIFKNLIVAILFAGIGSMAEQYAIVENIVSPLFPPTGIAFAAILIWGYRVLPGVWFGSWLMNGILSMHWLLGIFVAFGASSQAAFGAWLLLEYTQTRTPFYRPYNVFVFIFGSALLACLINATIGATGLLLVGSIPSSRFAMTWLTWWLGDSLGVITAGTFILIWYRSKVSLTAMQILELTTLLTLFVITAWIEYTNHWPLSCLLIPYTFWAAIRFSPQITVAICLLTSFIIFYWASHSYIEFTAQTLNQSLLLGQSYVAILFFTALMLVAVLSEREKAQLELQHTHRKLETRVAHRNHDLAIKNTSLEKAITDLKSTQSQLVHAEKMSSLGILTAGIAHEINNSVNFIAANINPLKNNIADILNILKQYITASDDAKIQERLPDIKKHIAEIDLDFTINETEILLNSIREGTQRTTAIVKDLRTFSRVDESDLKNVNLHQNIDSTLNLLKSYYKDRIKITKHYGQVPEIECYPGKLNQVIMNLLSNAMQAIPSQGEITITTAVENNQLLLHIKDTGTGMSKEVQQKIFEPFFTTKPVGQGTGLGLSISYKIVQDHHGTITVNSTPGKGTEFIICLPLQQSVATNAGYKNDA